MDFQSESFEKLRLRAFQPYHQLLCMSKNVEDVEDYLTSDIFDMLRHTYDLMVWLESPKSQLSKTFCRLKIS